MTALATYKIEARRCINGVWGVSSIYYCDNVKDIPAGARRIIASNDELADLRFVVTKQRYLVPGIHYVWRIEAPEFFLIPLFRYRQKP